MTLTASRTISILRYEHTPWSDMTHRYETWLVRLGHDSSTCNMTHVELWPCHEQYRSCGMNPHHNRTYERIAYGAATVSRLFQIIPLLCKRALQKRWYSAEKTYNFKEPTNRSHPIWAKDAYLILIHGSCCITLYTHMGWLRSVRSIKW